MGPGTTPRSNPKESPGGSDLPSEIGRAATLAASGLDPEVSGRARRSLAHILAWNGSASAVGDSRCSAGSSLTPTGSPLEFVFSSDRAAVRYTAEVEAPGTDPSTRLQAAGALYQDLSGHAVDPELKQTLAGLQRGPLRFGAWLSGRHDPTGDHYKLYAEIANGPTAVDAANALRVRLLGPERLMTTGVPELRLVGADPARARIELYYRVLGSRPEDLFRLMQRVGFEHRFGETLDAVRVHAQDAPEHRLPGPKFGLSYSVEMLTGKVLATTVFFSSRHLWGSDARAERQLRSMEPAPRRGQLGMTGSLPAYVQFIDSVPPATGLGAFRGRSRHNMCAIAVPTIGPAVFQIGIAAPWRTARAGGALTARPDT